MDQAARRALREAAGEENYREDRMARQVYGVDGTGERHPPEAVVRAVDQAQVSRVLAACQAHRVPVVARGAGSGMTGGALPLLGGVVLDLAGMNRILAIEPAHQRAIVQPGVVTGDLQAAAEAQGLFYPPDPASVAFCTVGGNLAENSGGLRAVKYGVTSDYVLALKGVLADGRCFACGRGTRKSVVGYDLTRLLVGSEGTLAVITEITLRLLPLPEAKATLSAFFPRLEAATQGVRAVLASGIIPVALELMDEDSLRVVEEHAGLGLPPGREALVLVELDGPPEVVARQAGELAGRLAAAGGEPVRVARDRAEADQLWKARRAMGPSCLMLARGKLAEDVAVPLGAVGEMLRRVQKVARQRGLSIPTFGHAGDGNLHVNVMYDPDDPAQAEAARQAVSDVFAHALSLGGTLSGEHGVGVTKLGFVGAELDPVAMELMRGIKRVFDPAGILNPHKAIPDPAALA